MSSPKKQVAILLPSLGGGGAEMHALRIANDAAWGKLQPRFVLCRQGGRYEPRVRSTIPIDHLLPRVVRSSALSMMLSVLPLRRWIMREQPEYLVSFLNHTTLVAHLAMRGLPRKPRFVVGLQNNFSAEAKGWTSVTARWFGRSLLAAHREADQIIALSRGVADDYLSFLPEHAAKTAMVYNAGYDKDVITLSRESLELPRPIRLIVACGRLTEQKDYPLLIDAFAEMQDKRAHLWILGDGHLRSELEKRVNVLGLSARVRFLGFQSNPYAFMAAADAFVLSSAWEGFGNVLVEAMAVGTPVVSLDCPHGPAEIIEDGRSGLLVRERTPSSLAAALDRCLEDSELSATLRAGGVRRAERFKSDVVGGNYVNLLRSLR